MRPPARLGPLGYVERHGGPIICETPGCLQTTREGKPHCPDHIEDHAYVQGILAQLDESEREMDEATKRGWRAINPDGLVAAEIVHYLRTYGERTVERIRREHISLGKRPESVTRTYAKALVRAGRVTVGRTTRGNECLRAR